MKLVFEDFNQLEQLHPDLSKRLREFTAGDGFWLEEEITVTPLKEYTEDQLEQLSDAFGLSGMDTSIYPNPIEYVDVEKFAKALADTLDESYYYYDEPTQLVLHTEYSW